jgi:hypothetical protein
VITRLFGCSNYAKRICAGIKKERSGTQQTNNDAAPGIAVAAHAPLRSDYARCAGFVETAFAYGRARCLCVAGASAARAIPAKLRPSAFAIVADLLLADGKIDAREWKFLQRLAVNFSIRARVASHVVEAMLVKNHL